MWHPRVSVKLLKIALQDLDRAGVIRIQWVDACDGDALEEALQGASMVWIEATVRNSCCWSDTSVLSEPRGLWRFMTVVDATLVGPTGHDAIQDGCEIVVHAHVGAICCDSDQLGAAVICADERVAIVVKQRCKDDDVMSEACARFAGLGLRSVPLRLKESTASAKSLAAKLGTDKRVTSVLSPQVSRCDARPARWNRSDASDVSFVAFEFADVSPGLLLARLPASWCTENSDGISTHIDWLVEGTAHLRFDAPSRYLLRVGLERAEDLWDELEVAISATWSGL